MKKRTPKLSAKKTAASIASSVEPIHRQINVTKNTMPNETIWVIDAITSKLPLAFSRKTSILTADDF